MIVLRHLKVNILGNCPAMVAQDIVNGRFVREWVCPIHSEWRLDTYTADVPAGTLKAGRNRITLRASYRIAEGKRQHAIAVNRLSLKWK